MKTKYILSGGFSPEDKDQNNDSFYQEILKDTQRETSVLIVPFAKDAERIPETVARIERAFNKNIKQRKINIEIANENTFIRQVEKADIIYLQGGKTIKLLETLKKFPNLKKIFEGKIIAGESAGANVLCKFYYSPSTNVVSEGLNIIPIKFIPHYKDEYTNVFNEIRPDLDNLCLKEYEYKVFNKD